MQALDAARAASSPPAAFATSEPASWRSSYLPSSSPASVRACRSSSSSSPWTCTCESCSCALRPRSRTG